MATDFFTCCFLFTTQIYNHKLILISLEINYWTGQFFISLLLFNSHPNSHPMSSLCLVTFMSVGDTKLFDKSSEWLPVDRSGGNDTNQDTSQVCYIPSFTGQFSISTNRYHYFSLPCVILLLLVFAVCAVEQTTKSCSIIQSSVKNTMWAALIKQFLDH